MLNRFLVLLIFSTILIYGCQKNSEEGAVPENRTGSAAGNGVNETNAVKAPNFTLKDVNGNDVSLSDFKGKVVILDFWATWCPPCRKGIPDLIELQNKYKNDLTVIGISLDQANTIKEVVPFYKSYGINYPVVYGNAEVVNKYGGIEAIPTSFIIDKEGYVVNKHVGLIPKQEYEKYLQ
jgi:thiol-disulfide isomerase/thioredoxin